MRTSCSCSASASSHAEVLRPLETPEAGPAVGGRVSVEGDDEVHHQARHRVPFRRFVFKLSRLQSHLETRIYSGDSSMTSDLEMRSGMTCRLIALCFDANDPLRLARFWAGVLGWEMVDDPHGRLHAPAERRHRVPDRVLPDAGAEGRPEPDALRPDEHLPRGAAADGGEGARARRPAHRRRTAPGGGARGARRPRGQRVLRHRAGQRLPRRLRLHRSGRRATARRRSDTSGARRWAGRWSGTRTRRPRSAHRTAVRSSPGAVRR